MIKNIVLVLLMLGGMLAGASWYRYQQADFTSIDGQEFHWRDLQGQWLVVNYFAKWCAPCLREVPELNTFAALANADPTLTLFAISYDSLSLAELQGIQQEYQMAFTVLPGHLPRLPMPKPPVLPATYIINPQGQVAKQLLGEVTAGELQATLAALRTSTVPATGF